MKKICWYCGAEFAGASNRRYCSKACRKRMELRGKAAEEQVKHGLQHARNMEAIGIIAREARAAGMSYGKYVGREYVERNRKG